jgi:hypothetical protein
MNRNTAIIATVATVVLCGCPGAFACLWGVMAAAISQMPGADINMGGSSDPMVALGIGIVTACVGIIGIAIPIVVGIVTLRQKS